MAKQCQSEHTAARYAALESSLLKLLHNKTFAEISVKDICLDAAIPRRTFYHYFTGKEDLLDALIADLMMECALEVMPESGSEPAVRQTLLRFFLFWKNRRETLTLLLRRNQAPCIIRHATDQTGKGAFRLTGNIPPDSWSENLISLARVTGVFSIVFHWVLSDCRESAEEMAACTARFLTESVL